MASGLGWQGKLALSRSQSLLWNQALLEKSQRDVSDHVMKPNLS